jgi:hypothetical protein
MAKPLTRRPAAQRSQGFVYKRRDPSVLKQRAEQTGGRFDSPFKQGFDTFRPKVGSNQIRILPPTWEPHEHYAYDLYMHRFIGQDTSNYLCLYKMQGKHCPICDAAKEARDAGEQDEAKALGYARVCCSWIIDRDDEQKEHPMLYGMGWTMDKDIAILCSNKRTGEALTIDHPTEGFDVSFTRTGQGLMTRYMGIQIDRERSNIDEDEEVQERILDYITQNPIPETLKFYDAEYLERILSGTTADKDKELDEDAVEEEEAPPRRRAAAEAPARRPTRRPVEEEEVVEEDEAPAPRRRAAPVQEEDEEPVAAPPRRRAAAAPPPEEEDDEVPFEEDEPAPRASKRRVVEEEDEEVVAPPRRRAAPVEEEDEPPPRARSGPPRRAAPVEEEEEIVEEEDEAPPARVRRPTARR